ncbi:MAG: DUF2490 domain-containing protein [Chitinophagales bacterium]|nr:DUF2490 domain-containing protein [Chitinophagaceae bacterium]MCB9065782.1 DUF2490 domain-containing protein [Chitinophagales bacterium]
MKKTLITLMLLISATTMFAQKLNVIGNTNSWFLLMNRFYLSDKFTVSNELHERTGKLFEDQATFIFRPSIDYSLNENVEFSVGYSYVRSTPYDPYPLVIPTDENNIWEQVLLKFETKGVSIQNRIRFEHRFVDKIVVRNPNTDPVYDIGGTDYSNRFRFRFVVSFDILKFNNGQSLFFNGFDEAWLNQHNDLMPSAFARNWIYTGLGYKFNKDLNLQLAHVHQYDNIGNDTYISSSVIQLSLFKNFKLY